ncbi:hypothetical protein [Enterococcus villorum]
MWKITQTEDGYYKLRNLSKPEVLDLADGRTNREKQLLMFSSA